MSKHRSRDGKIYPNLHDATIANRAHDAMVRLRTGSRRGAPPVFITEEHDFDYTIEPLQPGESVAVRQGDQEVTIFSYDDIGFSLEHRVTVREGQQLVFVCGDEQVASGVIERGESVIVFTMAADTDLVLDHEVEAHVMAREDLLHSVESGATSLVFVTQER